MAKRAPRAGSATAEFIASRATLGLSEKAIAKDTTAWHRHDRLEAVVDLTAENDTVAITHLFPRGSVLRLKGERIRPGW